jgi:flagellar biosynthetic protein FliQ
MDMQVISEVCMDGLVLVLYVIGPPLGVAVAVGLFIAVMQAATQIQEQSLTFVPKLIAIGVTLVYSGPWAMDKLVSFFTDLMIKFEQIGAG